MGILSRPLAAVAAAVLATLTATPALAAHVSVDPGIARAAHMEMQGFSTNRLDEFLDAFGDDPVLIDDSEPFFMHGKPAMREWFEDFWRGTTSVTFTPTAVTDYAVRGKRAYVALPFSIVITATSGSFKASGVWSGTFERITGDKWRLSSLTISLLSFG